MASVLGVGAVTDIGSGGAAVGVVVEGSGHCPRLERSVPFFKVRLVTTILGMHASYKCMAVGPLPKSLGLPPSGRERKREEQTRSLDRSQLVRSTQQSASRPTQWCSSASGAW
jgi:hypothetical protein